MKRWTLIAVLFAGWCLCKAWDFATGRLATAKAPGGWA